MHCRYGLRGWGSWHLRGCGQWLVSGKHLRACEPAQESMAGMAVVLVGNELFHQLRRNCDDTIAAALYAHLSACVTDGRALSRCALAAMLAQCARRLARADLAA